MLLDDPQGTGAMLSDNIPTTSSTADTAATASVDNDNTLPSLKPKASSSSISSPNASSSLMSTLAATIAQETAILDAYFAAQGGPQPSFDIDAPLGYPHLPKDIQRARQEVLRATGELRDLVTGPAESMRCMALNYNDQISLNAMLRLNIVTSFPVGSTSTYPEIAQKTKLSEKNARRFIQHAMTNRILKEVSPGVVAHTAASRILVQDAALRDWVNMNVEEIMHASVKTIEAVQKYDNSQEMTQCGFQIANKTENIEPLFATIGKDPVRAKRFGNAMSSFSDGEGYEVSHLVNNYDWARVNDLKGTMVDIGGSHGFVCVDVAKKFNDIKFVVQDLPRTVSSAPALPSDVADRISFQSHDFNTVQPVKGADVYFFRWIFHNQPRKHAINLIRQLIPALKHGARVVINDHCLPSSSPLSSKTTTTDQTQTNTTDENTVRSTDIYSAWDEKLIRTMDVIMLTLLNADERSEEDFRLLFEEACAEDGGVGEGVEGSGKKGKFRFLGVVRPVGCRMGIVEAVWEEDENEGVPGGAGEGESG